MWQEMDTAPKDGREVDLWCRNKHGMEFRMSKERRFVWGLIEAHKANMLDAYVDREAVRAIRQERRRRARAQWAAIALQVGWLFFAINAKVIKFLSREFTKLKDKLGQP